MVDAVEQPSPTIDGMRKETTGVAIHQEIPPGFPQFLNIIYPDRAYAQYAGGTLDVVDFVKKIAAKVENYRVARKVEILPDTIEITAEDLGVGQEQLDELHIDSNTGLLTWIKAHSSPDQSQLIEIIEKGINEIGQRPEIEVLDTRYVTPEAIALYAKLFNLRPEEIPENVYDMFDRLAKHANQIGPLRSLIEVNQTNIINDEVLPERRMLEPGQVLTQPVGSNDCVLYSGYHLGLAAGKQVELSRLAQFSTRTPDTFRQFGRVMDGLEKYGISDHPGLSVPMDIMIKALHEGKGGFILNLGTNHAVAVVGVRQERHRSVEFLVANSLPSYVFPSKLPGGEIDGNKLFWADGVKLFAHSMESIPPQMLQGGAGASQNFLFFDWASK